MSQDKKTSKISGFYKMPVKDRVEIVKKFADLTDDEANLFSSCLDMETADRMIENVLQKSHVFCLLVKMIPESFSQRVCSYLFKPGFSGCFVQNFIGLHPGDRRPALSLPGWI